MSDDKPSSTGSKNRQTSEKVSKEDSKDEDAMDLIRKFFADKLRLLSSTDDEDGPPRKVIDDLTFDGLTEHWKKNGFKNVITMVGAGISTSAGIPDFRSPGSGLYDNLQKYNLPHPSAIFEMDYFHENPQPFFTLAKELYPGTFNPTPSHYFVRLLHEKGLLLRHYTQNIDTLERIAGIPDEKLVEAHGTFYTNHCLGCRKLYSMEWMKKEIFDDNVPTCTECNAVVKPDIVFFGENLPDKFYKLPSSDFDKCDLLIIMGTSLEVQPFASLVDRAGPRCLRLLINRTKVGHDGGGLSAWLMFGAGSGLQFDSESNTRDIAFIGDCDDGVWALVKALGWEEDLRSLMKNEKERLKIENAGDKKVEGETSAELKDQVKVKSDSKPKEDSAIQGKDGSKTKGQDEEKDNLKPSNKGEAKI